MNQKNKENETIKIPNLKYYGKYSRKRNLKNEELKLYGYRKGEEVNVLYDEDNNLIIKEDKKNKRENEKKKNQRKGKTFLKNNNNNNYSTIKIRDFDSNDEEELIKFEKLGRKRKYENEELKTKIKKEKKNGNKCPICHFIYLKNMDENDKNLHYNECVEGRGNENIEQNKKKYEYSYKNNLLQENNIDPYFCPFCHQIFKKVKSHLPFCKIKNNINLNHKENNNDENQINENHIQ